MNWWFAGGAGLLAAVVAAASFLPDGPPAPAAVPATRRRQMVAGLVTGALTYCLYQLVILIPAFIMGVMLSELAPPLTGRELETVQYGVLASGVVTTLAVNVFLGSAIYPRRFHFWWAAPWSFAALLLFTVVGQLAGWLVGLTAFDLIPRDQWLAAIGSWAIIAVIYVAFQLAGALVRDGLAMLLKSDKG